MAAHTKNNYDNSIESDIDSINKQMAEIKLNIQEKDNSGEQKIYLDGDPDSSHLFYNNNKSILEEAEQLTSVDRAATHGNFVDNFETAARLYNIWTDCDIDAYDIAKILKCLKMARMKANPSERDNYVDDVGYTKLLYKLTTEY